MLWNAVVCIETRGRYLVLFVKVTSLDAVDVVVWLECFRLWHFLVQLDGTLEGPIVLWVGIFWSMFRF